MNITDIDTVPLHVAYEEVCRAAAARGLKVTGFTCRAALTSRSAPLSRI